MPSHAITKDKNLKRFSTILQQIKKLEIQLSNEFKLAKVLIEKLNILTMQCLKTKTFFKVKHQ